MLDNWLMPSTAKIKETRRIRLASLLKELTPTYMVKQTGIAAAELFQMSEGKGKSKRNVNDAKARLIEKAAEKPPGWLDMEIYIAAEHEAQAIALFRVLYPQEQLEVIRFIEYVRDTRPTLMEHTEEDLATSQDKPSRQLALPSPSKHKRTGSKRNNVEKKA